MCQVHETHVGMAGENFQRKISGNVNDQARAGGPGITHFQNTLHVTCTTVPKRFLLDIFHCGQQSADVMMLRTAKELRGTGVYVSSIFSAFVMDMLYKHWCV